MNIQTLATTAAVFVAMAMPHANALTRTPESPESGHATVSNPALPSALFEQRLEKAKANLAETRAAVELAHREQRPRPMVTRLAEKLPVQLKTDALTDVVEQRPSSSLDLSLREAIVGLALYLNPPFSQVANGVEKVPGPYPEEVRFMYAVAVLESIESGPIPSIEVVTLHTLARQLRDQSLSTGLVWIPQSLQLSSAPRGNSTTLVHGEFVFGEGKTEGPARSERPAQRGPSRERQDPPGSAKQRPAPAPPPPPPPGPPPAAPPAPTDPSPKPSPIDAADNLKPITDVELSALAAELEQSVESVRRSTKPRPLVQVPKSDPDNTAADLESKALKTVFKQMITRPMAIAFTAVDTFLSPTRISVASELTWVPGQYPEEAAYEKVLREIHARVTSRDASAKRKDYGEWVNSQTYLEQSEAEVGVPTLP